MDAFLLAVIRKRMLQNKSIPNWQRPNAAALTLLPIGMPKIYIQIIEFQIDARLLLLDYYRCNG